MKSAPTLFRLSTLGSPPQLIGGALHRASRQRDAGRRDWTGIWAMKKTKTKATKTVAKKPSKKAPPRRKAEPSPAEYKSQSRVPQHQLAQVYDEYFGTPIFDQTSEVPVYQDAGGGVDMREMRGNEGNARRAEEERRAALIEKHEAVIEFMAQKIRHLEGAIAALAQQRRGAYFGK